MPDQYTNVTQAIVRMGKDAAIKEENKFTLILKGIYDRLQLNQYTAVELETAFTIEHGVIADKIWYAAMLPSGDKVFLNEDDMIELIVAAKQFTSYQNAQSSQGNEREEAFQASVPADWFSQSLSWINSPVNSPSKLPLGDGLFQATLPHKLRSM